MLVSLLNQEGQKQTLRSTRQVSRKTGLIQCSIEQIIHRDLGLMCMLFTNTLIVRSSHIYILQGNVATPLRRDGIFRNHFIAYFPENGQ